MTDTKQIISDYFNAWTRGELDAARALLADELDFRGSIDTFSRADELIPALRGFVGMLERAELIDLLVEGSRAFMLYDCHLKGPLAPLRTAEHFVVRDGVITQIRLVFDATELRAVLAAGGPKPSSETA